MPALEIPAVSVTDMDEQAQLIEVPIGRSVERRLVERGEPTGLLLKKRDPERYAMVVKLYREGIGQLRLAELLSMSVHTVRAVLDAELGKEGAAERDNDEAMRGMRQVRRLMIEGLEEDAGDPERRKKIAARDKAVVVGILTQNHELLAGNATARVEVVDGRRPAAEAFQEWLKQGSIDAQSTVIGEEHEGRSIGEGGGAGPGEVAADPKKPPVPG